MNQPDVSFAKGGKPKPPELPSDCAVGETVTWDGTAFVCSTASITGWEIVQANHLGQGAAICPVGKVVLGGGVDGGSQAVVDSYLLQIGPNQWGWQSRVGAGAFVACAICADGSS